ncbi:hypothetical protein AMTR_s00013p00083550 [Amborella trichopoda]|uniref:Uncharacterized protein n=1 Tax=Amborella trichopoda TaxID=13333 RepID=W1PRI8_AMBTC|nr:hypothetical protein AMTR_s00013p00083550 [Amborella trichopoda]
MDGDVPLTALKALEIISWLEALTAAKELDGSSIVKDSKDSDIEELGPQEAHVKDLRTLEADVAEVLAELKIVKRQNSITHWLLSIMIVGSVIWRLSEVSLFLTVKDKLSNPLKSVGNLITSSFRGAVREVEIATESPPLPNIQMPPLPHLDLQSLHFDGGDK